MEPLPEEIIQKILLPIPYLNLLKILSTCSTFNRLCTDSSFWRVKAVLDFDFPLSLISQTSMSPREVYHRLVIFHLRVPLLNKIKFLQGRIDFLREPYFGSVNSSVVRDRLVMKLKSLNNPQIDSRLSPIEKSQDMSNIFKIMDIHSSVMNSFYQGISEIHSTQLNISQFYSPYLVRLQRERFSRPGNPLPKVHIFKTTSEDDDVNLYELQESSESNLIPLDRFREIIHIENLNIWDILMKEDGYWYYIVVNTTQIKYFRRDELDDVLLLPKEFPTTSYNLETVEDFDVLYELSKSMKDAVFSGINVYDGDNSRVIFCPPDNTITPDTIIPPGFKNVESYREFIQRVYN